MYDVAIIGAGVIGSAIARELSRYQANVCVIEREEDVCDGTSKANSAIIHAGFDAAPGSLKAKLNVRGNEMMDALSKDLDIPFKRNGSLVVCTKDQDRSGLDALLEKGEKNGVPGLRILERDELLQLEPNLSDDVTCGLYAPTRRHCLPVPYDHGICRKRIHQRCFLFLKYQSHLHPEKRRRLHVRDHPHRYRHTGNLRGEGYHQCCRRSR